MSVADLVGRVQPLLPAPVDELQVAALLESQGVTDQAAVEQYGAADVFALAQEVFQRLPHTPVPAPETPLPRRSWHDAAHGLLYLMPSAVYPAVFAVLGGPVMARGMVLATAVGWVWGAGTSWVAHQLLGLGAAGSADRAQRVMSGIGVTAVLAGAVALLPWGGGLPLVLFAVAQAAVQAAYGILLFHREQPLLLAAMLPAGLAGLVHLASGYDDAFAPVVLLFGGVSVLFALALAWRATRGTRDADGVRPPTRSALARGALPNAAYAAACAAFLLYTDARYVLGAVDLAVAAAPLVLGMGVVEWRANRVFEQADDLIRGDLRPAQFQRAVWRVLLRELTTCLVALGAFALLLLLVLRWAGALTLHGALLIDGHVLLGGAFFLGFVLIRTGGPARPLAIASGVLLACVAVAETAADAWGPHGHVPVFLVGSAVLPVLMLGALRGSVGQVRHHL
ncbi:hypothetical protein JOF41_002906 [Saccharothrix coeruleofusca]|uniref:hypothetical protein n=1 Tax=Saccharothrix coeruleofusca TaxID=33919 RepID=UPI001AE5EB0D|nr:hypothetical protein [Saccharothrix coeruleofusca]MBP2336728.1 hypothetical protein [Saccharothrix coeruleofusca]